MSATLQNISSLEHNPSLIHVLIVTYKSSSNLGETLRYLDLINNNKFMLSVSLVDCSGECAAIKEIAEQFIGLRTTVYDNSHNIGYAGGNNLLINELEHHKSTDISNSFLLILNPDIKLSFDVLLAMVTVHQSLPNAFAVSPSEDSLVPYSTEEIVSARIRRLRRQDFTGHKVNLAQINDLYIADTIAHCTGACLLIKGSILTSYRLRFSEDFFMYMEETKLLIDAAILGHHSYVILNKTILHDTESNRYNPLKCYYTSRNTFMLASCIKRSDLLYYYLVRYAKPSILLGIYFLIAGKLDCIIASIHGFIDALLGKSGIEPLYHQSTSKT